MSRKTVIDSAAADRYAPIKCVFHASSFDAAHDFHFNGVVARSCPRRAANRRQSTQRRTLDVSTQACT